MKMVFLERELEDGRLEITIKEGASELKGRIEEDFVFPEKLILTKEQKEENITGLRDLLTGAFCVQGFEDLYYQVFNEEGEQLVEYYKSVYDGMENIPLPGEEGSGPPPEGGGGGGDGHGGGCC